jgi:plastocyanin
MRAVLSSILVLGLAGFVMAIPSPSLGSTTWVVQAGGYAEAQGLQTQKFLPSTITVNEGDRVTWTLGGNAHTIFFPAGEKPPDLLVPGQAKGEVLFNSRIFFPSGKQYGGSGPFSAGVLEEGFKTRYTVTFTKAGTYEYLCMFHPGMAGAVVVQPAGSHYPKTQAEYSKSGEQEAQQSFTAARAQRDKGLLTKSRAGGKTTYTLSMIGSVANKFTVLRFVPQVLTIKAGDTVTWKMDDPSEIHTVTFPSGGKTPPLMIFRPQKQGQPAVIANPLALAPLGGSVYKGRGYFNSGAMEIITPHGVRTYSLTFTTPGRFDYTCIVHDPVGMRGTIIVTK